MINCKIPKTYLCAQSTLTCLYSCRTIWPAMCSSRTTPFGIAYYHAPRHLYPVTALAHQAHNAAPSSLPLAHNQVRMCIEASCPHPSRSSPASSPCMASGPLSFHNAPLAPCAMRTSLLPTMRASLRCCLHLATPIA